MFCSTLWKRLTFLTSVNQDGMKQWLARRSLNCLAFPNLQRTSIGCNAARISKASGEISAGFCKSVGFRSSVLVCFKETLTIRSSWTTCIPSRLERSERQWWKCTWNLPGLTSGPRWTWHCTQNQSLFWNCVFPKVVIPSCGHQGLKQDHCTKMHSSKYAFVW